MSDRKNIEKNGIKKTKEKEVVLMPELHSCGEKPHDHCHGTVKVFTKMVKNDERLDTVE
jgi:hypothetical protein